MTARTHCPDCNKRLGGARGVPSAPMLRDRSWALLAKPDELLCALCRFGRARARRVVLTLEDLKPVPVNLFHRPHSWFDQVARDATPDAVRAWLDEYDRALDFYCPNQLKLPFDGKCIDYNRALIRWRS